MRHLFKAKRCPVRSWNSSIQSLAYGFLFANKNFPKRRQDTTNYLFCQSSEINCIVLRHTFVQPTCRRTSQPATRVRAGTPPLPNNISLSRMLYSRDWPQMADCSILKPFPMSEVHTSNGRTSHFQSWPSKSSVPICLLRRSQTKSSKISSTEATPSSATLTQSLSSPWTRPKTSTCLNSSTDQPSPSKT